MTRICLCLAVSALSVAGTAACIISFGSVLKFTDATVGFRKVRPGYRRHNKKLPDYQVESPAVEHALPCGFSNGKIRIILKMIIALIATNPRKNPTEVDYAWFPPNLKRESKTDNEEMS